MLVCFFISFSVVADEIKIENKTVIIKIYQSAQNILLFLYCQFLYNLKQDKCWRIHGTSFRADKC